MLAEDKFFHCVLQGLGDINMTHQEPGSVPASPPPVPGTKRRAVSQKAHDRLRTRLAVSPVGGNPTLRHIEHILSHDT